MDVVAAGEDAGAGSAAILVDQDFAPVVDVNAGAFVELAADVVADGDDDDIGVEDEFGALVGDGAPAAAVVGFAEGHADAFDAAHAAVLAEQLDGRGEVFEVDALFAGVGALFEAALHFVFGAAVEQGDIGRAEADCGADAVHGGVAAADHDDALALGFGAAAHGGGQFGGRQVGADEELGGGVDEGEFFAFEAQALTGARAVAEENRVVLVEISPSHFLSDAGLEAEFDAGGAQRFDFFVDDVFGGFEVGDAVAEDATGGGPGFEDSDLVADRAHSFGGGQPGGAGADDGDALAALALRLGDGEAAALAAIPVAEEGFELADGDGFGVFADDADALAERFLRAEASAELGHFAGLAEDGCGVGELADFEEGERAGDVVINGAGFGARGGGALDAALGLEHGGAGGVAVVDLVPVMDALVGRLFGDVVGRDAEARLAIEGQTGARGLCLGHDWSRVSRGNPPAH